MSASVVLIQENEFCAELTSTQSNNEEQEAVSLGEVEAAMER